MAPPSILDAEHGKDFPAKLTGQVVVCSIIAAFGGLMFGYDIGISGGVTAMDSFLLKFFPSVYVKKHHAKSDNYCKYNNHYLQLFTSSLYLAAIVASFCGSFICKRFGRRPAMQVASIFFLIGALLNLFAQNLGMLIGGRLFLGAGIGFGNQAVPLFISEIAPPKYRGGLNICFQLLLTIGALIANLVNYYFYSWRISLGGAAVPALFLLIGSLAITETPTSLIERGKNEDGLNALKKIRGVEDVYAEYNEIYNAVEVAKTVEHPFKNLMSRSNRPQLICGSIIQIFQQLAGITVIMSYSPVLFNTMGLGEKASLFSALMANTVKPLATVVAILVVDRYGRRFLLTEGAIQMFIAQCSIGGMMAAYLKSTNVMTKPEAIAVIGLIAFFLAGFGWSWGPLAWLIPSEIYPLETRTAGYFFAVSFNMLATFVVAQTFLTMLCHMRSAIFFFFGVCLVIMCFFAICFLPETKGVPIDEMVDRVWKKHWFWKRYYDQDQTQQQDSKELV